MAKKSGIPISNKPQSNDGEVATKEAKPEKPEKVDLENNAEFQQKVSDAITSVKTVVDEVDGFITKAEEVKIVSLYKVGEQMNKLLDKVGSRECSLVVKRFHKEIGMHVSFFYLAMQTARRISKSDLNAMKKNGVTMMALKAIVAIGEDAIRDKAIQKAVSEGMTPDEIRTLAGKKGTRRTAVAKKNREKDKKKPPARVFTQGIERTIMVQDVIGSCTDAVARLGECKTEEEREGAINLLVELRKKIPDMINEMNAFMKFTANVSK